MVESLLESITRPCIVGHIPIKPALLRYVNWKEGLKPGHPLVVPGPTPTAVVFDLLLTNKTTYLASEKTSLRECTELLSYEIRGRRLDRNFHYVIDRVAQRFNTYLYYQLHDDLLQRVIFGKKHFLQEKDVIDVFLRETGLDDYYDFEAVKKAQFRLRKSRQMPTIRGHSLMRQAG